MKCKRVLLGCVACLLTVLFAAMPVSAYTDTQAERNYTYNQKGEAVYIPNAYEYAQTLALVDDAGVAAQNPQDFYIADDGKCYIADTDNNRILVLDDQYRYVTQIKKITAADGSVTELNKPQGIFVFDNGELMIADTMNHRLVRCDLEGNALQLIEKPAGLTGVPAEAVFLPSKVACDSAGRINVIATNINFGLVQLDSKGVFLSYIGAPKVQTDLFTMFWRKFSTEAQKNQMVEFVATEYSNLFVDDSDLIWGTISTLDIDSFASAIRSKDRSGSVTPIRLLNAMGNDVLKRNGQYAPLGDLSIRDADGDDSPSQIVDVAVGPGGIYSLLDKNRGHIFSYDTNGNLLYVFGNYGLRASDLQLPVAMAYSGDSLLVLDAGLGKIQMYTTTSYGKTVIEAVTEQYNGNFEEANALWTDIAYQNMNFVYAFEGLGSAQQNQQQYEEALESYKYATNTEYYSSTFVLLRRETMKTYFPILFGVVLGLVVVFFLVKLIRKTWRFFKKY